MVVLSRKFILALSLFGSLGVPCVSHAVFWNGYELKKLADADDRINGGNGRPADYQNSAELIGFVIGVHDVAEGRVVCAPDQVSIGQIVGMVKKYVLENPDKWNRPANAVVISALSSAFPCKR